MHKAESIDDVVTRLARCDRLTPELVKGTVDAISAQGASRRFYKDLLKRSISFKSSRKYGRLRAIALVGTSIFGRTFTRSLERAGCFVCEGGDAERFREFLAILRQDTRGVDAWSHFHARLETYLVYLDLVHIELTMLRHLREELAVRPRHDLKQCIVIAGLAFLVDSFGVELRADLARRIRELGEPEEIASFVSILVAKANELQQIDSYDFGDPEIDSFNVAFELLEFGRLLHRKHEIAKQISLFGYSLERFGSGKSRAFILKPPNLPFERAVVLGYIRSRLGDSKAFAEGMREFGYKGLSLLKAAEAFIERLEDQFCKVADEGTDHRRLRLQVPLAPKLYNFVTEAAYLDDAIELERLNQEMIYPLQRNGEQEARITPSLTWKDFISIWKLFRFLSAVDLVQIRKYLPRDSVAAVNSMFRVLPRASMVDLIASLGYDAKQVSEFLDLVTADVRRIGFFDLQYRPFLQVAPSVLPSGKETKPELVFSSAIVVFSNMLRNVQSSNAIRNASNADVFVDVVADILQRNFAHVETNRRVRLGGENTDIDVIAVSEGMLYLFECKYSLPPASPHELRDLWEDVERAVEQLQSAERILSNAERRRDYLVNWFPGMRPSDIAELRIQTCVLTSNRMFSGLSLHGVPVRDYASLALVMLDGIVGMGEVRPDGSSTMFRYSVKDPNGPDADLRDYLREDSRFFQSLHSFMYPVSKFERFEGFTLVKETLVYQSELVEWQAVLDSLGWKKLQVEEREPVRSAGE